MGRFGVAGRQVHANTWGKDNLYMSFVVALSLGPIQSYEAFTANTVEVTFPGAQGLAADVEPYRNKMWQTRRLGLPTDAYLTIPTGVPDGTPSGGGTPFAEWTSAHTLPGIAHALWTLKNNSKRASYESGVPGPLWIMHGMKLWDPREDSTYPGGSGSQRRDDWRTWAYTENPYLHALAWCRGHFKLNTDGTIDRTKRIAGVGAPDAAIDIGAFVEGANVAEANDWKIAGEWTTVDDKWQVLAAMLQAGGGTPLNRGAKISCMVEAPRTSILTLTGEDIVGSVSMNVMASRRDRPNTIVPRVRLEAQRFEEVALGAVTASTYVTEDGGETRTREVPYRYVGQAKQGAELAAYGLANARETLKASIPCKPHLLGLRAGDAFTVTEPELGLSGQKFVVLKRAFDPSTAIVTLDVRSETDAKHAWALGQSANPPETPTLTASDPIPTTPVDADWTVTVRPADTGGIQLPGLIVEGAAVGDNVGAVQIEVGLTGTGPWEQVYHGPPTTETVPVNGLLVDEDYYVAVTYWSLRGVPSEKLVKGPYTTSDLVIPLTPGVLDDADVIRGPGGSGGGTFTGDLDATNDFAVATLENDLLSGAVIPAESTALTGEGPLAKSSLTEAQVQGRYLGAHAGDTAANTAGLQNGDIYVDTSLVPSALKAKTGGVITEVDTTGIRKAHVTQTDVSSSTYTTIASIVLTGLAEGSIVTAWATMEIEASPIATAQSSVGSTAPAGDYTIQETDGVTQRALLTGTWASVPTGGSDDIASVSIDGLSNTVRVPTIQSPGVVIGIAGDRTYYLSMRKTSGYKSLLHAGFKLFVQIQRPQN